jgi:hypothetical protein
MKGWQRVAIVLSVIEFVGVGGLLWVQYVGTNNEFYGAQLRACVAQLNAANQSLSTPSSGERRDRSQSDNFDKYLTCQVQAAKSLAILTESQKQTMWTIAAIDAALLAAAWLLGFGVVAIWRRIFGGASKSTP